MWKVDLIYVIITEKILKIVYSQEDDLSKEKANELLKKYIYITQNKSKTKIT